MASLVSTERGLRRVFKAHISLNSRLKSILGSVSRESTNEKKGERGGTKANIHLPFQEPV